jgi:hypothetical protein
LSYKNGLGFSPLLPVVKRPVIFTDMLGYERYSVSNGTLSLGIIYIDFNEDRGKISRYSN